MYDIVIGFNMGGKQGWSVLYPTLHVNVCVVQGKWE